MFTVELYAKIRHAVMVDGLSCREAAKRFGVHRNTIAKMLSFSVPPACGRRDRPASKKLGLAWIDAILEGDRRVHKKQRHTAHRIFERLRDEQGFTGGFTIVREYVAQAMLRTREMCVPLSNCRGHAQADFGEADGYIGGKKLRFHYFCMDLPHPAAVSSRRIWPKRRKLFAMAMWRHSISSAACRNRFCTTIYGRLPRKALLELLAS